MASTFTPNVQIEEPARGDDVGTWDTPVNANSTLLDLILGGTATISLNNANVVLAANQFQCRTITFNSTLTGNVAITFPSSFKKDYIIQNICTGSSQFIITLNTTAAGSQVICCPPGQPFDILNDGANIKFKNFGPQIGGYWDYAGSSVPAWVSGCSIPPYLNCDGSAFSAVTYPALAAIMGTTLPDFRGRGRVYLNQGTGRVTSSAGIDGNTLFAAGGSMTTLSSLHLPQLIDPGHLHSYIQSNNNNGTGGGGSGVAFNTGVFGNFTSSATTGITYGSSGQITLPQPPGAIGGLTLIRSA